MPQRHGVTTQPVTYVKGGAHLVPLEVPVLDANFRLCDPLDGENLLFRSEEVSLYRRIGEQKPKQKRLKRKVASGRGSTSSGAA